MDVEGIGIREASARRLIDPDNRRIASPTIWIRFERGSVLRHKEGTVLIELSEAATATRSKGDRSNKTVSEFKFHEAGRTKKGPLETII